MIGQARNEAILRSHLEKLGVRVELSTELVGFEQDEDGVRVKVINRDGSAEAPETVEASFLVGADGAKSTFLSHSYRLEPLLSIHRYREEAAGTLFHRRDT